MTIRVELAVVEIVVDVLLGERLEQALLADAAHVVAGVALAVVEDPEVDVGGVQKTRDSDG